MQRLGVTTAALFADADAAADAVTELTRIGAVRDRLAVVSRNERASRDFAQTYGVRWVRFGSEEAGLLANLGRLVTPDEPRPDLTLFAALTREGIDRARAAYFDDALVGSTMLLIVPADAPAAALHALTARRADLGSGTFDRTIELREERLTVGKQLVPTHEVVLRTEVVSETQRFEIPLEREDYVIERTAVNADGTRGETEIIRIPIRHEEVTFQKRTVVTAEVQARREQIVETRAVSETVRREVLHVEGGAADVVHTGEMP